MNIKDEKSKEFLKLQRMVRDLRMIRYSNLGTSKAKDIEKVLQILEPMVKELQEWLNNATKPKSDYDI